MRRAATVLAALLALAAPARAEEIRSFDSVVRVQTDGSLDVTETITVTVTHDQVKRGIFRDFPVQYTESDGSVTGATLDVLSVTRDGEAEPYAVEPNGAYRRIRIGDPDVLLPAPSEQTYAIRYRTQGQLRAFKDRDELYWNVTGNEWAFPIEAASVEIDLPKPADFISHAFYTGYVGETGADAAVDLVSPRQFHAHTTMPLAPGEGFTVAVGWPSGLVTVPPVVVVSGPPVHAPETVLGLPTPVAVGGGGTLAGIAAFFLLWLWAGRDPRAGVIYPRFDPPEGLSAAACRYVWRQDSDDRCLTAAIVGMAVKGALSIVETERTAGGRPVYALLPEGDAGKGLGPAEARAYAALFRGGEPLTLSSARANGRVMDRARIALAGALAKEHRGVSFHRNGSLVWIGAAAGIAATVALGLGIAWGDEETIAALLAAWGLPAAAVIGAHRLVGEPVARLRAARDWPGRLMVIVQLVMTALPIAMFAGILVATDFPLIDLVADSGVGPTVAAGALFGLAVVVFEGLLRAPTRAGRKLLDEIEGLRLYLGVAEEDRLNALNPPERTPERFEALLPWAIALDLTHEWAARFTAVLAGFAGPAWYAGQGAFDPHRFTRSFDDDVSRAVSTTTAPARSSSSGSSGGGSSGGGGGGGGGGGW